MANQVARDLACCSSRNVIDFRDLIRRCNELPLDKPVKYRGFLKPTLLINRVEIIQKKRTPRQGPDKTDSVARLLLDLHFHLSMSPRSRASGDALQPRREQR